jgi:hypothetical protein
MSKGKTHSPRVVSFRPPLTPNLQAPDAFAVSARALRILVVADGEVNFYALAGLLGESRMHRLDIATGFAS